ncbi:hypothetical protein SAMN05518854_1183 [Variovorax sp. YR266]|jgi:hypothetical protein|uniref:hypothetical protein n=1 Tax=Variovorax sp. YR266 TaxID=1884386 RepID=UPI0008975B28|nr:hypothetical protein [Variovorax sp. YR266]SDZ71449.1 hypothetical protein SAMN05518854_1183 [Variovorax sp. YR266]
MNDELEINCPHHGRASLASVCGHLIKNRGTPLGFIENNDDPDDKQGWCYACELVYLQEEDKTERFIAFTDYTVVCSHCYDQIKAHHQFDVPDGDRIRTRDDG